MFWPNTLIVVGTLLIAGGGIIATHGWNERTNALQRKGLIQAVAAELMVNIQVVSDPKFTETDAARLQEYVVFPRTQTIALEAAIASGQFLAPQDRLLFTRLVNLAELLAEFNNRLSITEAQTASLPSPDRVAFRAKLRDGKIRATIDEGLKKLGQLLMSDYGIDASAQFFVELDGNAA